VTSKIRSRHDFRYKYGCLEISRGDATERLQRDKPGEGRHEKKYLLTLYFWRRVIAEWLNRFAIRRLVSRKVTAWKQYRTFSTQELLAKYKSIASRCRSTIFTHFMLMSKKVINSDNINKFNAITFTITTQRAGVFSVDFHHATLHLLEKYL